MSEQIPQHLRENPGLLKIGPEDLAVLQDLKPAVQAVPAGTAALAANQLELRWLVLVALGQIKRLRSAALRTQWCGILRDRLTVFEPFGAAGRTAAAAAWAVYRSWRCQELDGREPRPSDPAYAAWEAEDAAVAALADVAPWEWRHPLLDLVDAAERGE